MDGGETVTVSAKTMVDSLDRYLLDEVFNKLTTIPKETLKECEEGVNLEEEGDKKKVEKRTLNAVLNIVSMRLTSILNGFLQTIEVCVDSEDTEDIVCALFSVATMLTGDHSKYLKAILHPNIIAAAELIAESSKKKEPINTKQLLEDVRKGIEVSRNG